MKCQDIMTRNPSTCAPSATAQAAALIMSEEDVGIVPVVEPDTNRLVGVVTDRDLCLDVVAGGHHPAEMRVSESLHGDAVTCRQMDDVELCLEHMKRRQVHRIPIVDDDGICVGIVSQSDLALHLAQSQMHDVVQEIAKPRHAA